MRKSLGIIVLFVIFFIILAGIIWKHYLFDPRDTSEQPALESEHALPNFPDMDDIKRNQDRFFEEIEKNPCGHLSISPSTPLFNISGKVNSAVLPGAEIKMFITPNTSLNHSLYVVDNCMPLWRSIIDEQERFSVHAVPPGKYVLYLPSESFLPGTQGFPLPDEFIQDGYELDISFHGGDHKHSLGAFEIRAFSTNRSQRSSI